MRLRALSRSRSLSLSLSAHRATLRKRKPFLASGRYHQLVYSLMREYRSSGKKNEWLTALSYMPLPAFETVDILKSWLLGGIGLVVAR